MKDNYILFVWILIILMLIPIVITVIFADTIGSFAIGWAISMINIYAITKAAEDSLKVEFNKTKIKIISYYIERKLPIPKDLLNDLYMSGYPWNKYAEIALKRSNIGYKDLNSKELSS